VQSVKSFVLTIAVCLAVTFLPLACAADASDLVDAEPCISVCALSSALCPKYTGTSREPIVAVLSIYEFQSQYEFVVTIQNRWTSDFPFSRVYHSDGHEFRFRDSKGNPVQIQYGPAVISHAGGNGGQLMPPQTCARLLQIAIGSGPGAPGAIGTGGLQAGRYSVQAIVPTLRYSMQLFGVDISRTLVTNAAGFDIR
jgi:hypothetical protein